MRQILFFLIIFLLLGSGFTKSSSIFAQDEDVGCITSTWTPCNSLSCKYPCRKTLKQPGSRNVPGQCTCEIPPPENSIPENGICQEDTDCVTSAPYCWPNNPSVSLATCHKDPLPSLPRSISIPIQPLFCDYDPTTGKMLSTRIQTAIGCIPTDPQKLLEKFLPWFMGLAGGIAFFLMLAGAFTILTSAGNPEKVKVGQERLTSAIIGLLFIIFSVFLIRIIGLPIMEISR